MILASSFFARETSMIRWVGYALSVCLVVVLVRTAWVCDDAYITFRTVENAVTGHGLRFNAGERVQAYTHPLWMALHLLPQAIWHSPYWATLVLSITLTLLTKRLLTRQLDALTGWVTLPMLAIASKAFVEFSTSGLENPLTHLLLVLFVVQWWRGSDAKRQVLHLSLIAAAMLLNRMDTILLVGPALATTLWRHRPSGWRDGYAIWQVCLGFLPFLLWEVFSVIYYGFPFPNTAYAKLGAGIDQSQLWQMGWHYYEDSFARDPITLPVIGLGILVGLVRRQHWALVLGIVLYLVYIARIGGDFMSGRFFTAPFLLAVMIICKPIDGKMLARVAFGGLVWMIALLCGTSSILTGADFGNNAKDVIGKDGIADERAYYYPGTGLLHALEGRQLPDYEYASIGKKLNGSAYHIDMPGAIGMIGYYAGPEMNIVDRYGLSDPLFARVPALYTTQYRPGHYARPMIEGYVQTVLEDSNLVTDPIAYDWNERLRLITRGPIFSIERLSMIIKLNLGLEKPRGLGHFRVPTYMDQQLPLPDTSTFETHYNFGVRFWLPKTGPRQSLSFDYCDGNNLFLTWLHMGKPLSGRSFFEHATHTLPIPPEADAFALYPDAHVRSVFEHIYVW